LYLIFTVGHRCHCSNNFLRSATIPLSGQGEDECEDNDDKDGDDDRKEDPRGGREEQWRLEYRISSVDQKIAIYKEETNINNF